MSLTKILTTTLLVGGMMFNYIVRPALAKNQPVQIAVIDYNSELEKLDELYGKARTHGERDKISELITKYKSIKLLSIGLDELERSIGDVEKLENELSDIVSGNDTDNNNQGNYTDNTVPEPKEVYDNYVDDILNPEIEQSEELDIFPEETEQETQYDTQPEEEQETQQELKEYPLGVLILEDVYLDKIMNIPDQPKAVNPAHNFCLQRDVADMIITTYACELEHGRHVEKQGDTIKVKISGNVSGEYCLKARDNLIKALESRYTTEEVQELAKTNPGISILFPIISPYIPLEGE